MKTILPADVYKVYRKCLIMEDKKQVLTLLYQPIIGITAVSLYLNLLNDIGYSLSESDTLTHHHLMTNMQLNLDAIEKARQKLEAIGLMKTYYREDKINSFIYVLYSPISANEFLNHPILNVVLYNNVGKMEYENIVEKFRVSRINIKDYKEITCSFDDVFTAVNGYSLENKDIVTDKTRKIEINSNIDINLIISAIPRRMTSDKCFNKETVNLIINLAYLYKIDNLNMQGLVRNAINEKGMIDGKELRNLCRNFYQFENNGKLPTLIYNKQPEHLKEPVGNNSSLAKMIYTFENISPYDFLKNSYNNAEPTMRDKKIVENLIIDQQLNPGVVNVLIDYVLKTNNKKLNKEFIETIAGQWKRLSIETVSEAMDICRKEHKKAQKSINKIKKNVGKEYTSNVPDWFNKDNDANIENLNEFDDVLKGFD